MHTEIQYEDQEQKREEWEMQNNMEGEKTEVVEIFEKKGLSKQNAKQLVEILATSPQAFLEVV